MIPLKHGTVVVPIDFSPESVAVIGPGFDRVNKPSGLHVVHVLASLDPGAGSLFEETVMGQPREEVARQRIEELIRDAGATGARAIVLKGDPGLEIANYAKQLNAELIVVPSHGYHGIKRLLLGSTAERIIRHAHCSVLVLRRADAD